MDFPRSSLACKRAMVLVVEDDSAVRRSLQLLLQANGFDVRAYASSRALLSDEAALGAACLVADYRMTDPDGIATLRGMRERGWSGPAILITAYPTDDVGTQARTMGFEAVFEKPLRMRELVTAVKRLVRSAVGS